MKYSETALAWGGVVLAGALWGGGAPVAQQLMAGGMAPSSLTLARFGLGLPLLLAWAAWQAGREASGARWRGLPWRTRALVLATGAAMALNVGCWFAAIGYLGAALPTVIATCCAPLCVALVSALRGYERVGLRLLLALAGALAGTVLVVAPQGAGALSGAQWKGVAWSLGSAAMHALVVLGNARMPRAVSPLQASAWGMAVATGCAAAIAVWEGLTWPQGPAQWWGAGYTGVLTTAVAYLAFAWGARRLSPTAAGVGILVEPLVAAWLAAWWLGETLGPGQWAGALLLGMAILSVPRRS